MAAPFMLMLYCWSRPWAACIGTLALWKLLVVELPVLVLAKQCDPDGRQGLRFEQLQSFLEGVVDVDTSVCARNHATASAVPVSL
jgi:hypothetical protein